jgi:hypothetical protein
LHRHNGGVRAIVDPQFVHGGRQARLHRAFSHAERGSDLLVKQPFGDEAHDRFLAIAEERAAEPAPESRER